jgi:hypothetical protein
MSDAVKIQSAVQVCSIEIHRGTAGTGFIISQHDEGEMEAVAVLWEDWPRVREAIEAMYAARKTPGGSPVPR